MRTIDLNADLGEDSRGEDELYGVVSSVNIACAAHAGSHSSMRKALRAAKAAGVAIGAHPGYADPEYFGRRELVLSPAQVTALVAGQVRQLAGMAMDEGVDLQHVKPHGALYNQSARDEVLATAVIAGVTASAPGAGVFAPAGSALAKVAQVAGIRVWHEAFADRAYQANGALVPRGSAGAVLDEQAALAQVVDIVTQGKVCAVTGEWIPMPADTLCVHGDGPAAAVLLTYIRAELERLQIAISAPSVR